MADATPATTEAAPARRSTLLVAVIAAVIAAGGAGAGVYFMQRGKAEPVAATKEGTDEAAPKAPAMYVKFDPPFVVNFEAKGMVRFLQVSVEVMTRDPQTADLIKLHDPMLRNELLMLLGSQTYDAIATREGKENLRNQALQAVAAIIAAQGGAAKNVEQLYFTSFVMQ
jgi:flagellar protein FliL